MKRYSVYASVSGVMALLVALAHGGEMEEKEKPTHLKEYFVRATQYHKSDIGCDHWTKAGKTSTQLCLPDEETENNPDLIGLVAVDPSVFQIGGLVYEVQIRRFFIAVTGGDDVINRTSAIALAGNSPQKRNAPVFDFYSKQEIVKNYYTYCLTVPHQGEVAFRDLRLRDQKMRLDPRFWLGVLEPLYDSSSSEEDKAQLREMMNRLREMIKSKS